MLLLITSDAEGNVQISTTKHSTTTTTTTTTTPRASGRRKKRRSDNANPNAGPKGMTYMMKLCKNLIKLC